MSIVHNTRYELIVIPLLLLFFMIILVIFTELFDRGVYKWFFLKKGPAAEATDAPQP
jgi:hypothetical protein